MVKTMEPAFPAIHAGKKAEALEKARNSPCVTAGWKVAVSGV